MNPMTNAELTQTVVSQQQQLAELAQTLSKVATVNTQLLGLVESQTLQINGSVTALQIFSELIMAANPEIKEFISVSTGQMLARQETINNDYLLEMIRALNKAATTPARTTPETRRLHFQLVPNDEKPPET
jgi:ubiquinone biosynthesis protein UbiJ